DLIPVIDPGLAKDRWAGIRGAEDPDVTGGMRAKVASMLNLVAENPQLKVRIFGGLEPGSIAAALTGAELGTLLARR
ncbi:MAG TPA: hypothetical protein VMN57_10895, partial [Anaerolineales bacterium]|nr:hypothetical protein [Anaerolineales bacterium]